MTPDEFSQRTRKRLVLEGDDGAIGSDHLNFKPKPPATTPTPFHNFRSQTVTKKGKRKNLPLPEAKANQQATTEFPHAAGTFSRRTRKGKTRRAFRPLPSQAHPHSNKLYKKIGSSDIPYKVEESN